MSLMVSSTVMLNQVDLWPILDALCPICTLTSRHHFLSVNSTLEIIIIDLIMKFER